VPPTISHDAFRYVWDAHLLAHGLSPYIYPASDPILIALRDHTIWPQLDWPNSPTIYPPGAESFFLLINVIAPLNIMAMKLAMGLCDLGIGLLTLLLLRHYRLDPRRVIIYWWNPIPVLEFFYNGHVDAAAVLWTVLAVLLALQRWRGARILAGIALGLAALTKLYPLLFALVLLRRRDWGFLLGLSATLVATTVPFIFLGLGSGGFLTTYFSQRFVDQGLLFRFITQLFVDKRLQFFLQGLALLALCALVFRLYRHRRIDSIAGILALFAAWILVSPHLFPWYVGGMLPLVTLRLRLPRTFWRADMTTRIVDAARSATLLPAALWLFALAMPFTYVIFAPGNNADIFLLFFAVPLSVAALPAPRYLWGRRQMRFQDGIATTSTKTPISLEE
jgi:Glycosyltransferase family 87